MDFGPVESMTPIMNNSQPDDPPTLFLPPAPPNSPCHERSMNKPDFKRILTMLPKKAWADLIENDDKTDDNQDDKTDDNQDDKEVLTEEQYKQKLKEREKQLSRLTSISISYTNNYGDTFNRTLQIVQQSEYEKRKKLIEKMKSHPSRGYDKDQQKGKIKLANSLMSWCHRGSRPGQFIYPVASIHLRPKVGESNIRYLIRDVVDPDTRCFFEITDMVYSMPE
jgi:hypothetical protein